MAASPDQDERYARKLADLQKHVPFIETMINHLKNTKEGSREVQLTKMESLHTMITDNKRKFKYDILLKCEEVIDKLKNRMKPNLTLNSSGLSKETPNSSTTIDNQANRSKSPITTGTIKSRDTSADSKRSNSQSRDSTNTENDRSTEPAHAKSPNLSNRDNRSAERSYSPELENSNRYQNDWNSYKRYRPFSMAKASKQNVILPLLLEAMKDGDPTRSEETFDKHPNERCSPNYFDHSESCNSRENWRNSPPPYKKFDYKNDYYQDDRKATSFRGGHQRGYSRYEDNSYNRSCERYSDEKNSRECKSKMYTSERFGWDEKPNRYSPPARDIPRINPWLHNQENVFPLKTGDFGSKIKTEDQSVGIEKNVKNEDSNEAMKERFKDEKVFKNAASETIVKKDPCLGKNDNKDFKEEILAKSPKKVEKHEEESKEGADTSKFAFLKSVNDTWQQIRKRSVIPKDGKIQDVSQDSKMIPQTPKSDKPLRCYKNNSKEKQTPKQLHQEISTTSNANENDVSKNEPTILQQQITSCKNVEELEKLKNDIEESIKLEDNTRDLTTLKNITEESTNLKNITEESTKLKNITEESTKLKNITEESTKLKNITEESTKLKNITEESTKLKNITEESTKLKNITEESTKLKNITEESTKLKNITEESTKLKNITEESSTLKDNTRELTKLQSNTEESTKLKDNTDINTYSKYDKMYSTLTKTHPLKSPLESLYTEAAQSKKFKIPKKQTQREVSHLQTINPEQHGSKTIEVKVVIEHVMKKDNSSCENIMSAPEFVVKDKEKLKTYSKNDPAVKERKKHSKEFKAKRKRKIIRTFEDSDEEIEESVKAEPNSKGLINVDEDDARKDDLDATLKISRRSQIPCKEIKSEDANSKNLKSTRSKTLKSNDNLKKAIKAEDSKLKTIKSEDDNLKVIKSEDAKLKTIKSEDDNLKTQEHVAAKTDVKIEENSSIAVEKTGESKNQVKPSSSQAISDSTEILDFILKNYKQIKKIFEDSSSDDEDKSKKKYKKKVKHKKKKRKRDSSSSSTSSIDAACSDSEDASSSKKKKVKDSEGSAEKPKIIEENLTSVAVEHEEMIEKEPIKKKKGVRELDMLHQDIKEMWMSNEIIKATGKRSCTIPKDSNHPEENKPAITHAEMIENAARLRVILKREDLSLYNKKALPRSEEESEPILPPKKKSKAVKATQADVNLPNLHDRNYYPNHDKTECKLCSFKGKAIANHYSIKHKGSEVLSSRLNPDLTERLIKQSELRDYAKVNLKDGGRKAKFTYICPFCPNDLFIEYTCSFYDHLSSHTGEFRHYCTECNYSWHNSTYHRKSACHRRNKGQFMKVGPSAPSSIMVFGYVCGECYYLQMLEENLGTHVGKYHGGNSEILKVNLNLADLYPDNSEEAADSPEDEAQIKVEESELIEIPHHQAMSNVNVKAEAAPREFSDDEIIDVDDSNDLAPFICEEDSDHENLDEKRLKKMNQILKNVNLTNAGTSIADKLHTKLSETQSSGNDSGTPLKFTIVQHKRKPSRAFLSENSNNESQTDGQKPKKKIGIIRDIITRLQDNLQPKDTSHDEEDNLPHLIHYKDLAPAPQSLLKINQNAKILNSSLDSPSRRTRSAQKESQERPPPLIHYKTLNAEQKSELIVEAGPIKLLKNADKVLVYGCMVTSCVFSTSNVEHFANHCRYKHPVWGLMWQCKKCDITFDCNMYGVFLHVRDLHARNVIDVRDPESVLSQSKFKCVITSVKSLANEPASSTSSPTNDPSPPFNETQSPATSSSPANKKEYIRPVPLSKLMAAESDILPHPSTSTEATQDLPANLNGQTILKKTADAADYLLEVSRLPHFYKCPVSDCLYSAFAAAAFLKHCETHVNCYVFCLYCSAIVKLFSYIDHLTQFHHACRYACSNCFYRASSISYLKAHIDMEHRTVNRVLIVSTPLETLPARPREEVLPPIENFIKPYVVENAVADTRKTAFFERELTMIIDLLNSPDDAVLCGYCSVQLDKSCLFHFAEKHGMFRYHCRYCKFGDMTKEPLIQHMAKEHSNRRCCILSRLRPCSKLQVINDDPSSFDYERLVVEEEGIKSKYSKRNGAQENVRITRLNFKKQTTVAATQGACDVISSIKQFPRPPSKQQFPERAPRSQPALVLTEKAQPECAPDELRILEIEQESINIQSAYSLTDADGTIYPFCTECGLRIKKPACVHLKPYRRTDTGSEPITAKLMRNVLIKTERGGVVWKDKLIAEAIIDPIFIYKAHRFYCGAFECKRLFFNENHFEVHLSYVHSKDTSYYCDHCNINIDFESKPIEIPFIVKHFMLHGNRYPCRLCHYTDDCPKGLNKHIADMHEGNNTAVEERVPEVFSIVDVHSTVDANNLEVVEKGPELTAVTQPEVETEEFIDVIRVDDVIEKPAISIQPDEVIVLSNSEDEVETNNDDNAVSNEEQLVINDIDIEEGQTDGNSAPTLDCDTAKDAIASSIEEDIAAYKRKGFVKPYGPHPTPLLNCYKCPMCSFATAEALTMAEHLILETDVDKENFFNPSASREEKMQWIHELIRFQTNTLYFWCDFYNGKVKKCKFCPFMGATIDVFHHRMTHYAGNTFACTKCSYITNWNPYKLSRHYRSVHQIESRKIYAQQESRTYNIKSDAPNENESFLMKIMTEDDYEYSDALLNVEQRGACHHCHFEGNYAEHVTHYKKEHPDKRIVNFKFTCSECTTTIASFAGSKSFEWHNTRLHEGKARALVAYIGKASGSCCNVCLRVFQNTRTYLMHLRTHTDTYRCRLCEYTVHNWRRLRKHYFDSHNGHSYDFTFEGKPLNL